VHVIFGLGNPGRRYHLTRHNVGFILLDFIQSQLNIPFRPGKGDYHFCAIELAGQPVVMVKPMTYMNRSGLAVQQVLDHFDLTINECLIIYDDFNLPFGELRFRARGQSGGHKGIESVIYHALTEQFDRLKIGIGHVPADAIDFVLSKFEADELAQLEEFMLNAHQAILTYLEYGIEKAMNQFNRNILKAEDRNGRG
jgi:peptidyl-tRNA hydrolase, PTH1 family